MYQFLENDLEQASLEWLEEIGYEVHNGSELASDGINSEREDFSEVVLKNRLKKEGSELVTNCNQLKLQSSDGKFYNTDVADTEQLFRLIQSVPSKKAEPFKLWLAQVGRERIDEIEDPELGFDRLMETYLKKGY